MTAPYYADDLVTLYHGDCLEVTDWLAADVLVTDPPYGRGWSKGHYDGGKGHPGIAGDADTTTRDAALTLWGPDRLGVVFGAPLATQPAGTRQILVWQQPGNAGLFGSFAGWRRDWDAIHLIGPWTPAPAARSSVLKSLAASIGNPSSPAGRTGHPHTKPLDLMELLLTTCPPGVVADPFAGSGTTLLAAKRLGRRAIGVELEERYCDLTARRLDQGCLTFGEAAS